VPFEEAPMGTTGLETAFASIYTADILPLSLLVEKLSAGAALMGLPTPRIEVGRPADVVLIDLDAQWEVGEAGYESRAENCCFAGRTLRGKVVTTIAAGGIAYRERAVGAMATTGSTVRLVGAGARGACAV
jgi:dihydroorotase